LAGDPSNLLPFRWAPGQSGNPNGSSEKRRQARRLRQALDMILADEVPPFLAGRLDPQLLECCPPGMTFAELVALRLVWSASTSTDERSLLAAAQLIVTAQKKRDELEPPEVVAGPDLETTDERRRAVASQLGVDLDEPPADPAAEHVH